MSVAEPSADRGGAAEARNVAQERWRRRIYLSHAANSRTTSA